MAKYGFQPVLPIRSMTEYVAGTNAAIYPGDAVMMGTDGKVVVATAGNTFLVGVSMSYKAATGTTVLVCDHPDQKYYIRDDGAGSTALAQTNIGSNTDLVATAGNSTTLASQHKLDRDGTTIVGSAQLRILGLGKHPADAFATTPSRYLVVLNEHFAKSGKIRGV